METKYTDYLTSRGWTTSGFYDPDDDDYMTSIECGTVKLHGWGRDKTSAGENLEVSCKEYVTQIEEALNLELVP
jgi:adenylosuccinate synthase